jgi:hypothetical protein
MNIGNPIKAIPRYAKVVNAGLRKKPFNTFDPTLTAQPFGKADTALYQGANWVTDHRLETAAGALGAVAVNQMLGNPIGELVDFATFGMTDFKPDRDNGAEPRQSIILQQPGMQRPSQVGVPTQPAVVPALNEEDRKRQKQYLERKIATDLLTVQALAQQPGMEGY